MTKTEIIGLLALLESEYPQSFARLDAAQKGAKINLWGELFAGDDGRLVWAAVKTLISGGREFAPSAGQIKAKMLELSAPRELDESEAWALVTKACSNGIYGAKKEFDALPPEVQAAVGGPEQIRAWAAVDPEHFQTVVGSNFRRAYQVTRQRRRDMAMLPADVREMIGGMAEKMMLTETEGEDHVSEI